MLRTALTSKVALLISRVYVIIALVIAALFSLSTFSIIPLLLLIAYLYFWWRPVGPVIHLLLDYFNFFALAILFSLWLGPVSIAVALPVLLLVHNSLLTTAASHHYRETTRPQQLTGISISLFIITGMVMIIALLMGNFTLIITAIIALIILITLVFVVQKRVPPQPVEGQTVEQRMVAGGEEVVHVRLKVKTAWGGNLFLQSSYTWLHINPDLISLRGAKEIDVAVTIIPPLAGPSDIKFTAYVTDCWGVIQSRYEIIAIKLYVIPRARYAAWFARKYLEGTGLGTLPLIAALRPFQLQSAWQGGVEYYGTRPYQAGDSLKHIDWKHSLKYNELVSKDFQEFHGQAALLLVNLAVTSAEEGDKQAYNIIMAALSLARENIPAVLAAYNEQEVKSVSPMLSRQNLVTTALENAQAITYLNETRRYLAHTDVTRLQANLSRIRSSQSTSAAVLSQLFQMEYRSLAWNARRNPVSVALAKACLYAGKEFNIVVVSRRNHDADALAFTTFAYKHQGHAIVEVESALTK